jgi:aspartate/glutamate racemase
VLNYSLKYFETMTELLQKAIAQLQALPSNEQDAIARIILEEIEEERRWDQSFARSSDILAKLASEAMSEHQVGKTEFLDPEIL